MDLGRGHLGGTWRRPSTRPHLLHFGEVAWRERDSPREDNEEEESHNYNSLQEGEVPAHQGHQGQRLYGNAAGGYGSAAPLYGSAAPSYGSAAVRVSASVRW